MKSTLHTVLDEAFDSLPPAVRACHDNGGHLETCGLAEAQISPGLFKALVCRLIGFPRSGVDQPVTVVFEIDANGHDRWQRDFAGRRYRSWFEVGSRPGELVEHQFPFTNVFKLRATPTALHLDVMAFKVFGIPLPRALSATCAATETDVDGRLRFDIKIGLPLLGPLIHYAGELSPVKA